MWKLEVVLEGSEWSEWVKGEELQQNKGWKWEAGTRRGESTKDFDKVRRINSRIYII